jgi:NTP pyrophosphatase (non-canonical NTP hydrolase)
MTGRQAIIIQRLGAQYEFSKLDFTDSQLEKIGEWVERAFELGSDKERNHPSNLLDFKTLAKANLERCESAFHPLEDWTAMEWAVCVGGEFGEMAELLKKLKGGDFKGRETETVENIGREIADQIIYLDLLAQRLGLDLGTAVRRKFNEGSDRYGSPIKI